MLNPFPALSLCLVLFQIRMKRRKSSSSSQYRPFDPNEGAEGAIGMTTITAGRIIHSASVSNFISRYTER